MHQWTLDNGYQHAVVFIRDENTRSRDIRLKQGFVYMYTKPDEIWADGSIAKAHCYALALLPLKAQHPIFSRPEGDIYTPASFFPTMHKE